MADGYQDISILNSLTDLISDTLTAILENAVSDGSKANLVRPGKLQADPTTASTNILIHRGGKDWPDEVHIEEDGIYLPAYEVGGGESWERHFIIELVLFFKTNDRIQARMEANLIESRCIYALKTLDFPQEPDSFGESAQWLQVRKSGNDEEGGVGTFIWRGEVRLKILTSIKI